jgi:hypothetical protein
VDIALDGTIHVRRYLCRCCKRTVSLLPKFALPYLRFGVVVIALFLVARFLLGLTLKAAPESAKLAAMPYQRGQFWVRAPFPATGGEVMRRHGCAHYAAVGATNRSFAPCIPYQEFFAYGDEITRVKLRLASARAATRFRGAHARRMRIAMARVAAVDQQAMSDLNWRKGSERSAIRDFTRSRKDDASFRPLAYRKHRRSVQTRDRRPPRFYGGPEARTSNPT